MMQHVLLRQPAAALLAVLLAVLLATAGGTAPLNRCCSVHSAAY